MCLYILTGWSDVVWEALVVVWGGFMTVWGGLTAVLGGLVTLVAFWGVSMDMINPMDRIGPFFLSFYRYWFRSNLSITPGSANLEILIK